MEGTWAIINSAISLLVLGGVIKLAIELGGFREWRKNTDMRLERGEARMDRHSGKIQAMGGHGSNGELPTVRRR